MVFSKFSKSIGDSNGAPIGAEEDTVHNSVGYQCVGVGIDDMMLNADNVSSHFENTGKKIQRGIHAHTLDHFNALRTQHREVSRCQVFLKP